ncbi:hypothetical protein MtrunA17_Chr7g0220261 [Medicago truncatula]|uniref:Pollen Ole e I family allergen n=1 Tax=Medicago truncatula TaxID=3880 RepID=A0A396H0T9_MEDTR|nr:hypothetical protein MtrunA17_Chr7g0220261 [Medicago truncatula]
MLLSYKKIFLCAGASVEVECKDGNEISKPRFKKQVKTNEHGEFKIQLPFSVSKHVKRIKGCVVKLVSSNEPFCSIASAASSSSLHLKSRKQGLHIFSAGFFSFKPLKQPNLCNQKPSVVQNTKKLLDSLKKTSFPPKIDPSFPPPLQDPNPPSGVLPFLPPVPLVPEILTPILPPELSPLIPSGMTSEESKYKSTKTSKNLDEKNVINLDTFNLPPNPFLSPPLVPNNPLQPPTSTPLVPNPLQPPPLVPNNPLQPPSTPHFPDPFHPTIPLLHQILPPILSPLVPNGMTSDASKSKSTKTTKNVQSLDEKKATNLDSFNLPPNPFFPPPLLPNNPLQPPSTPTIPNPFQPPTPTPLVPNNPFLPPPSGSSPLFPFPSVPGLSPSPPPSSPPGLAFPFPPLFPPPGSGTPPASTKNVSP